MKLIRSLVIILLLGVHVNVYAAADDDRFGWMNSTFDSITTFIAGCIEVPQFASITKNTHSLNLNNSGEWVSTGTYVAKDKLLQIEWSTKGVQPRPAKYKVLYRIDPRFAKPQIFIQRYDYAQDKYISDFHQFKNGQLLRYQDIPEMAFQARIRDFTDYFNFNGRSKISVKKADVINITIDNSSSYFGSKSEMNSELGTGDELLRIYTQSALPDNRVIYSNAMQWCADGITPARPEYTENCLIFAGFYWDVGTNWKTFEGRVNNNAFNVNKSALNSCLDGADGQDNNPLCYYDKGRGMKLAVGGTTIKPITEKFVHSPFTGKEFFYYKSDVDGDLDFITDWSITGMYNNYNQLMESWNSISILSYEFFTALLTGLKPNLSMNFVHFGRYLLDIEIGSSNVALSMDELDKIEVEYKIMSSGTPNSSISGTSVDRDFRGNANGSGYLWLRVLRPNEDMTGNVQVKTANYTGSTWFSDVVYGDIVKPLREKFNELSELIYNKLISNVALQNIARSMLVIYIIIYGLMFLAGATKLQ